MFADCSGELVRVRYRWDSRWYIAKLKSHDVDGTYTAILSDGFIQFGTPEADVWRGNFRLSDDVAGQLVVSDIRAAAENGEEDLTIWTAAKFGDVELIARLMEEGSPHDEPEPLKGGQSGRTPLYWACLCGHTEAARLLLDAGATDPDGAAWDAVTAAVADAGDKNVIEDASADLRYDPDEGIEAALIGEFGEEDQAETQEQESASAEQAEATSEGRQNTTGGLNEIRNLLVRHGLGHQQRVHTDTFSYSGATVPRRTTVFVNGRNSTFDDRSPEAMKVQQAAGSDTPTAAAHQQGKVCIVCWEAQISAVAVPCGHAVACWDCLTKIRMMRETGCPLCRSQIREISRLPPVGTAPARAPTLNGMGQVTSRQRKPQAYAEG
jgi:hypothetical protein